MIIFFYKSNSSVYNSTNTLACKVHNISGNKCTNVNIKLIILVLLKKIEYGENVYFRFITCQVKHFTSFLFRWLVLTANEIQKSVSQNIVIFTFEFQ